MSSDTQLDLSREDLYKLLKEELGSELQDLEPRQGVDRFLDFIQPQVAKSTYDSNKYKLGRLPRFCELNDIQYLSELDADAIDRYTTWIRDHSSERVDQLSPTTMRDEAYLLKKFFGYLDRINAVKPDLSDAVSIPTLPAGEGVRDVELLAERLEDVLSFLEKFHYGSLDHAVWILGSKGRRTGCIIAPDIPDAHLDGEEPYIDLKHRPPETRLKNGVKSECRLELSQAEAKAIRDFIHHERPDIEDPKGREPLLATRHGRPSKGTIRKIIYRYSCPCVIGNPCPEGKDPSNCKAAESRDKAAKCPASRSPHALKHGFITEARRKGVPVEFISERCDVSIDVLLEVYDESTEADKSTIRRKVFAQHSDGERDGYL